MILGTDKDATMSMSPEDYVKTISKHNLIWEKAQIVFDLDRIVEVYGRESHQYKHYSEILKRVKDAIKTIS